MKLLFATNNKNKITEIQSAIGTDIDVIGLEDAGLRVDIPEPYDTLEKNASEKSSVIYAMTANSCFSEDTGLEIEVLNNEPGVKSARYAGEGRSDIDNIQLVLEKMNGQKNRKARFRTVISLIWKGKEYLFEGICVGNILTTPRGNGGFGYDAIFQPEGSNLSFAEMSIEQKNGFSHRKKAAGQLVLFLQQQTK